MILLLSIGIGLISAFIPALQAAKTDINKTLSEKKLIYTVTNVQKCLFSTHDRSEITI